jgi:hypothetical protein
MDEWLPEPQEAGSLEPPRRPPPTAVGVATPPPPRGPLRSRYRHTRMERIGRAFALLAVSTFFGLAAGEFMPIPLLLSLLVCLAGGRMILQRQRSPRSQRMLHWGSSSSRRAA